MSLGRGLILLLGLCLVSSLGVLLGLSLGLGEFGSGFESVCGSGSQSVWVWAWLNQNENMRLNAISKMRANANCINVRYVACVSLVYASNFLPSS